MTEFLGIELTLEDYWRAIILLGKNVTSYKFALAKSLLELAPEGKSIITLEELAEPFSRYICEHLASVESKGLPLSESQGQPTPNSYKAIEICKDFHLGNIDRDELIQKIKRDGFKVVLDKFHNVNSQEISKRFYVKRRGGITLTDELFQLIKRYQYKNLPEEVESRWQATETAWGLGISRNLISANYDPEKKLFFVEDDREQERRVDVTSSRGALNAYQKGKCFYCMADISIVSGSENLADVDHFFAHSLTNRGLLVGRINELWNLVLACQSCNSSKSDNLPHSKYLKKLICRNEYLTQSPIKYQTMHNRYHLLRKSLVQQIGNTHFLRVNFQKSIYAKAQKLTGVNKKEGWEVKSSIEEEEDK